MKHLRQLINGSQTEEFQSETFTRCKFTNIEKNLFTNCKFERCDLSNFDFSTVEIRNCEFVECKLLGGHFETKLLPFNANFHKCNLQYSNFVNIDLKHTTFETCDFTEARFLACELKHAQFSESVFSNAIFQNCDLQDTIFKDCLSLIIHPENNLIKDTIISPQNSQDILSFVYSFRFEDDQ